MLRCTEGGGMRVWSRVGPVLSTPIPSRPWSRVATRCACWSVTANGSFPRWRRWAWEAGDLEAVLGDVTDPRRSRERCGLPGGRAAGRIRQVNVRGTDVVLGVAHRAGLDPIA